MGHADVIDSMIHDGLWCAFEQCHMGNAARSSPSGIYRARVGTRMWRASNRRRRRRSRPDTSDEILPVSIPQKKESIVVDRDEHPSRYDGRVARQLKPAFKSDGSGLGNAPGNDGASALVVMAEERARGLGIPPMAQIVGQATSGLPPKLVLMTPVDAVQRLMQKVGWDVDDVDLIELNEAFSVQAVAVINELGLDAEKVNVHGGAVALGHAIGSSGARILTTLLYALERRGLKRGIATLCLGGGNGVALAVERM
jgi:acetyl-CoA C-acetyltransferase